ncbi:MAG: DNA replication/repair protein RecF [Bacteroidetes bacterium]|nr:MAG: DNA replication/repair protein RecF [Bacteroidota bacterium]
MFLKKINLLNFKNYPEASLELEPGVNALVGANGEGKTNLLDAIHYLSLCKSYFNPVDAHNIRFGEDFFMVQGVFEIDEVSETISCGLKRNQKKVFKRNQKEYDRLADHIGLVPVVMISPTDTILITEGSEERRKFLDSIISQFDKNYLDDLINYSRVLSQRNAYLKYAALHRNFDADSLLIWDEQMIPLAERIYKVRSKFISELVPIFKDFYKAISGNKEVIDISYESHLSKGNLRDQLDAGREKDRALQYSTVGIHKDDLTFLISDVPVKRYASQGQQKSFLIALKLAQFNFVATEKGQPPILLLDDIFDKLDDSRVTRLMELVCQENFGQLIITDSHAGRLKEIFKGLGITLPVFQVQQQEIKRNSLSGQAESQHA